MIRKKRTISFLAILACGLLVGACAGTKSATRMEKSSPSGQKGSSKENTSAGENSLESPAYQAEFQKSLDYIKGGRPDLAQKILEGLAASHKDRGDILNALGLAYKKQGMTDKAAETYRHAIELQDANVVAHYNLGILYREQGEFKKAEEEYRHAIFLDPDFAPAHYNLGILYDLYLNRPDDALKQYEDFKRLSGENKEVEVWIKDLTRRSKSAGTNGEAVPSGGVQ
jgi:tetratricopeptide (TPR) repeat protein